MNGLKCTDSDHPVHVKSIIQAFFSPVIHSVVSMILLVDSEDPDQTASKCRLIWAFAICISPETGFCLYDNLPSNDQNKQTYCAFDFFQNVVFCLALYTEEVNLQTFVMI